MYVGTSGSIWSTTSLPAALVVTRHDRHTTSAAHSRNRIVLYCLILGTAGPLFSHAPDHLATYIPIYLPTYLHACLHAYLPTLRPINLSNPLAHFLACLLNCTFCILYSAARVHLCKSIFCTHLYCVGFCGSQQYGVRVVRGDLQHLATSPAREQKVWSNPKASCGYGWLHVVYPAKAP